MAASESRRYTAVAIVLHWAIAIGILAMIPFGWWMSDLIHAPETRAHGVAAFQLHKSIGLSILALSLARLAWRFLNPPPALPAGMAAWERIAATATHWGFYFIMIALPLSGWLYVSTGFDWQGRPLAVPTLWFGLFEVPHLPIAGADEATRQEVAKSSISAHSLLAWGAIGLAALHVGAALKHHVVNKDGVMARMVPGLAAPEAMPAATAGRRIGLSAGLGAVALTAVALTIAALTPPPQAVPVVVAEAAPEAAVETVAPQAETPAVAETAAPAPEAPPAAAQAVAWRVNAGASSIAFGGDHAGAPIAGRFSQWQADIRFSPEDLAGSRVRVDIQTGSATTENPLHQATLREGEWFAPDRFPTATFEARTFRALGSDRYEAQGTLRIRDQTLPVTLPFTLRITGERATMRATLSIDRVAAGMGLASDPGAEWVSRQIPVTIQVEAAAAR
jgi:cytochrome b561/polyisoprenoid-binding protein YceI